VSVPIAGVEAQKGAGTGADRRVGDDSEASREDLVARFVDAAVAGDTSAARDAFAQLEVESGLDVAPEARDAMRRWLATSGPEASRPAPPPAARRRNLVLQSAPGGAPARANLDGLLALDDLVWSRRGEPRYDDAVRGLARQFAARATDPRAQVRARDYLQWLVAHSTDDGERDAWRRMLEALPR
jgi:hypothetical protein